MGNLDNLLKNRKLDFSKLLKYGFVERDNKYVYEASLIENKFDILVIFSNDSKLEAKVIDLMSNDEYLPLKVQNAVGEYVGKVREAYENKLIEIINECSEVEVFKSNHAKMVIKYIKEKYGNEPEFLWDKFEGNAVFRHKENKKWYGALLTVSKDKLGLEGEEKVEVIDLKILPEDIEKIVDNKKYFLGYHMNKRHWFTIILDGSVELEKIFKFIDESYNISK